MKYDANHPEVATIHYLTNCYLHPHSHKSPTCIEYINLVLLCSAVAGLVTTKVSIVLDTMAFSDRIQFSGKLLLAFRVW